MAARTAASSAFCARAKGRTASEAAARRATDRMIFFISSLLNHLADGRVRSRPGFHDDPRSLERQRAERRLVLNQDSFADDEGLRPGGAVGDGVARGGRVARGRRGLDEEGRVVEEHEERAREVEDRGVLARAARPLPDGLAGAGVECEELPLVARREAEEEVAVQ